MRKTLTALAAVVALTAAAVASAGVSTGSAGKYGETYNANPALLLKAFGTTKGIPQPILASVVRAAQPVSPARLKLALKCWKDNVCDTGTGGKLTVALADGFGDNVWREVVHMEWVLQALTYPQIGKLIYTNAHADTQKALSDLRSLIAQKVNVIVGFPDAGAAVLPVYRQAMQRGIVVVPYVSGPGGTPGKDYLTLVAENLCALGKNFATVLNKEVPSGEVAFLGGTPGNPLSQAWQRCEKPALKNGLKLVGTADTNWTRQGALEATSGFISKYPNLKGISYEYADGFLGSIRAYQAANKPLNVVLTLRTDEEDLFCQWKSLKNPNFKVFYSSGGGFDSRIALTTAMMNMNGYKSVPGQVVVPTVLKRVTASTCNPKVPGQAPASTLVPNNVLSAMYPAKK